MCFSYNLFVGTVFYWQVMRLTSHRNLSILKTLFSVVFFFGGGGQAAFVAHHWIAARGITRLLHVQTIGILLAGYEENSHGGLG